MRWKERKEKEAIYCWQEKNRYFVTFRNTPRRMEQKEKIAISFWFVHFGLLLKILFFVWASNCCCCCCCCVQTKMLRNNNKKKIIFISLEVTWGKKNNKCKDSESHIFFCRYSTLIFLSFPFSLLIEFIWFLTICVYDAYAVIYILLSLIK